MVLLPEEVGEKGFLESRSPTFRIDSSRKGHARGPVLRVPTGSRRHKRALDTILVLGATLPRQQKNPARGKKICDHPGLKRNAALWQRRIPEIGKKKI
ncbi:hypothetical protein TNCV_5011711 [Trichonephila clavipes]|nr:hypothetical protein TNCV_5011711 [Trichonephila clavipes]